MKQKDKVVEHQTRPKTDATITPLLPASQYNQEDIGRVVDGKEGALAFIEYAAAQAQAKGKPFFMVLSLINPHDVLFQPQQFAASGYPQEYLTGAIGLPASINESLVTKPTSQLEYRTIGLRGGVTPSTYDDQLGYM